MHAWFGAAILILSAGCCGAARAETVTVTASEYRPVIETSNGAIAACGLAFSIAVSSAGGQAFNLQGSFSLVYPSGKEPASRLNLTVTEVRIGQVGSRSITSASLFDNDRIDTSRFATGPSQAGFSSFAQRSQDWTAFSELQADILAGQIWLTFNLSDTSDHYNLHLPPAGNQQTGVADDILKCNAKAAQGQ